LHERVALTAILVGVDVCKERLDVVLRLSEQYLTFKNDARGIVKLALAIQKLVPEAVVVEATGALEMPLVAALAASPTATAVSASSVGPVMQPLISVEVE
jgi:transposase